MSENSTHSDRQNGIRNTVVGIVIFITVVLALFINRVSQERILSPKEMVANGAVMFSTPREISALSLIDQNQLPFTKNRFANKGKEIYHTENSNFSDLIGKFIQYYFC